MNREEFEKRFRGELLNMAFQAWSIRNAKPSEFGFLIDKHALEVNRLLTQMYDALRPVAPSPPKSSNGPPTVPMRKTP